MLEEKKQKKIFQDLLTEKIPLQLWKYFLLSMLLHFIMIGLLLLTPLAPVRDDYEFSYQTTKENGKIISSERDRERLQIPSGAAVDSTGAEIPGSFHAETPGEKEWAPVYQYKLPRKRIDVVETEEYIKLYTKQFLSPIEKPSSSFSINVGKRSYLRVRQMIKKRKLPPRNLVRIEEMINYFFYNYPQPEDEHPFSITTELGECPWNKANWLLHVGIMGKIVSAEEIRGDSFIISRDMKIQVQFNPVKVKAYRIIGFSSRRPKVGKQRKLWEIGGMLSAGQSVTTLYEIIPEQIGFLDKPGRSEDYIGNQDSGGIEISTIRIRYRGPEDIEFKWVIHKVYEEVEGKGLPSDNFRFSAAVAKFGMILMSSEFKESSMLSTILDLANDAIGEDRFGYRAEFVELVEEFKKLSESEEK